jgi:hypothetical protein
LRRERRALRHAASEKNADAFANRAISAMRVACAPHYPAEPRALVGSEIIRILGENGGEIQSNSIVQDVFRAADLARYNASDREIGNLLTRQTEIERVIDELEAKL